MDEEQKIVVWEYNMMFAGFARMICCINWVNRKVAWEISSNSGTLRYESFADAVDVFEAERISLESRGKEVK